jgi:protein KRI1
MVKPEPPKSLFDSEDEDETKVKINKKFAKDFESRKQQEELKRVRWEGGDESTGSSSDESSEDDEAELLTTKLDVDIIKTINAVRNKDSRIYDPNTRFFAAQTASDDDDGDSEDDNARAIKKIAKPKRYKDVIREQILEKMDKDEDDDGSSSDGKEDEFPEREKTTSRLAYDAAQRAARKAFLESTKDSDDDESSDAIIIIRKKKKRADDDDDTDEETQNQLVSEIEQLKASTKVDKDHKLVDPKGEIEDGEAFLLNYFKNRPWIEKKESSEDDDSDDEDRKVRAPSGADDSDTDASLDELEEADEFEAAFNFRFEQAAGAGGTGADHSNVTYARGQTMNTLRRKDESRSAKRKARQERKAAERKMKEEQLKRLKNAKRQEMQEKLRKIKTVLGQVEAGRGGGGGEVVDEAAIMKLLEGDFDPEKFEELMQETYNDDFYQQQDQEWTNDQAVRESLQRGEDGELLVGQDDVDGGLYDNDEEVPEEETGGEEEEKDYEGVEEEEWPDDDMDEDEPTRQESELEKKVKAKMEDELYKLDYEDIVAGMPTRFKYRQVEPNNYGLSTEEILFARDSTLKQFVSLKKLAPYTEQEYFVGSKKRRRFRDMLKSDLEEVIGKAEQQDGAAEEEQAVEIPEVKKKKRRRLKKGSKSREEDDVQVADAETTERSEKTAASVEQAEEASKRDKDGTIDELKAKRRRRKKGAPTSTETDAGKQDSAADALKPDDDDGVEEKKIKSLSSHKSSSHKHQKKQKKRKKIEGMSDSRLASYGL